MTYVKYPRTPHLPYSPGATSDDKKTPDTKHFEKKSVVVTEKMDGENFSIYKEGFHARSLDSAYHNSHWPVKDIWSRIRHDLPPGMRICGENLYARHSIAYNYLPSFFLVYSVWDQDQCLDWEDTLLWCELLELHTVPLIYSGLFIPTFIQNLPFLLDTEKQEGFVMRNSETFQLKDFERNVAKWVRPNHVESKEHWKSLEIIPNKLKT